MRYSLILSLLICDVLYSQQIFYDSKRDKQATDAAAAAKDVSSGAVYDKMQRNAARQAEIELKNPAAWQSVLGPSAFDLVDVWNDDTRPARPTIPPDLNSICVQKSVYGVPSITQCRSLRCRLDSLQSQLNVDEAADNDQATIKARLERIELIVKDLKVQIDKMQKDEELVKDKFLKPLLNQLETGQTLLNYAKQFDSVSGNLISGRSKALGEIETALTQIKSWTTTIQNIWVSYQGIKQSPLNLRPLHQLLDLDLVMIEQERLKQQGLIYARLHQDTADVLKKLRTAQRFLCTSATTANCDLLQTKERIEDTLEKLAFAKDEESLNKILTGLFELGSAFAQGGISVSLCSVREGGANRAAEIRRAAAGAKATDKVIEEATQRLALYYKSGITPTQIATLAFTIASGISAPVAAAK